MQTIIYWFSGTGNSLAVAEDLAELLGDTRLVPVATAIRGDMPVAERVGVVFPVYAFGTPALVEEFLKKLPLQPGTYYFSVATMGGKAGATHTEIQRLLKARGADLAAGWSVVMPPNYPVMAGAIPEDKQKERFERADRRLREIAALIQSSARGILEDSSWLFRWLSLGVHGWLIRSYRRADRKFIVGPACVHCGLCAKVCPVENIKIVDGKPVWQNRCEQCFACLQWCPTESIQYGAITAGRKRYHHPRYKAAALCLRK